MNIGISQINNQANYKNNTAFGSILYTQKAVQKAKRISLDGNRAFLGKCRDFAKNSILKDENAPRAIIYSILGALGLKVLVVDTREKGAVKNHSFKVRVSNDNPFLEAETYARDLMNTNEFFDNVQIAEKEDFIPGPSKSDVDESGIKGEVKYTVLDREIYDRG